MPESGGYLSLDSLAPRERKRCSWCRLRRLCTRGRWSTEFPAAATYEVWICNDCMAKR